MYVHPTAEQFDALRQIEDDQPIVMLNLLRFAETANAGFGCDGMTGAEAYREYGRRLNALDPDIFVAEPFSLAKAAATVIGPADEVWDEMLLVRYTSVAAFIGMVTNPQYLEAAKARDAAVADSRLVMVHEVTAADL